MCHGHSANKYDHQLPSPRESLFVQYNNVKLSILIPVEELKTLSENYLSFSLSLVSYSAVWLRYAVCLYVHLVLMCVCVCALNNNELFYFNLPAIITLLTLPPNLSNVSFSHPLYMVCIIQHISRPVDCCARFPAFA